MRQEAVARHDQEDAALAIEEAQQHGRQGDDGSDGDDARHAALAHFAQDERQRFRAVGEAGEGHGADRGGGDKHIDKRAGDQRSDDAYGQIAFRILGFLRCGRDGVEAVKGEEDDCGGCHDAALDPVRSHMLGKAEGHERFQILGVEGGQGEPDEQAQRRDLDEHQQAVQPRAFMRAEHQQPGDHGDDEDGGQVDEAAQLRPLRQRFGKAYRGEQWRGIARPADRDSRYDKAIFEDQAPPHDPGDAFAQHDIGVAVGAARCGHHGRQFGIGKRGAGADCARYGEGEEDGGTGPVRADADQRQDAGADDSAHPQRQQMRPGQGARHAVLVAAGRHRLHRLAACPAHDVRPLILSVSLDC